MSITKTVTGFLSWEYGLILNYFEDAKKYNYNIFISQTLINHLSSEIVLFENYKMLLDRITLYISSGTVTDIKGLKTWRQTSSDLI